MLFRLGLVELAVLRLAPGRPGLRRSALLLWCLIVATVIAFRRIRPLAAVLLLPYLAWAHLRLGG
ncbi:MAG: tryptophan-rich sensory protein [Rhodocyclaceae bacterium]|nr:tryptophan-rich sensory protein [Rhodocyclaceae bacterium]